jgi:ArsR family transcriptional regulator
MPNTLRELKAELFKVLANPVRVSLLDELRSGPLTVGDLQRRLGIDSSNTSQHLAILRGRLLVTTRRDGNNIWYSVEEPRVYEILDAARAILENQLALGQRLLNEQPNTPAGTPKRSATSGTAARSAKNRL